jgi:hypothetical protein
MRDCIETNKIYNNNNNNIDYDYKTIDYKTMRDVKEET